ncbi:MAG: hypothetical protein C0601_05160 [Candidatus Muiribacterium halophilum]|uniref:HAD family hydrolase n=1 Tax=Muiribacterium halophilum TaxID=2053465 RepID=A0A2N5ZIA7_MUIH1|nr:MAG: hypothetical protein C0601_05160 [Candidatus Muirbacterium halophilum]
MKDINIIFDADDTLWENQLIFNKFTAFFEKILEDNHINKKEALERLLFHDQESYKRNEFGNVYYCQSMKKTLKEFGKADDKILNTVQKKHDELFNRPPEVFSGVKDTLIYLKEKGFNLYLMTKGYYPVQMKKVEESNLEDLFISIIITTRKDKEIYENICRKYKFVKENTYMVGNSPKSDIIPAAETGMNAIYIPSKSLWELEHSEISQDLSNIYTLTDFNKLKEFFDGL